MAMRVYLPMLSPYNKQLVVGLKFSKHSLWHIVLHFMLVKKILQSTNYLIYIFLLYMYMFCC